MNQEQGLVLLVEDDQWIVEMYEMKLKAEGFDVMVALDGKVGLELAIQEKPNLILLDVILPEMDGFSVLRNLKNEPFVRDIPVILLTNLGQDGDVKRGLDLGAQDYLVKANFTPSEVVSKVKSFL